MPTNIGQIRAKAAWGFAQNKSKEYGQYAKKFPMYIKTNGLVNAIAFAYSNKKGAWNDIYSDIQTYFKTHDANKTISELLKTKELMAVLVEDITEDQLRILTSETFALFTWLKRFVKDETSNS